MRASYRKPLCEAFSLQRAIEEQVAYEDMVRWAQEEEPEFVPVPDTMPRVRIKNFALLRHWVRMCIP
jgi:hypothetical protein